jgi:hypothetical protein
MKKKFFIFNEGASRFKVLHLSLERTIASGGLSEEDAMMMF